MKGNQGLDLLAAMSDAAKAEDGRPVAAAPTTPATAANAAQATAAATAQVTTSWPTPTQTAGPPGADALAAALTQQGGANNLIQAAAGLLFRQQQQQQQQQLAQMQLLQQAQAAAAAAQVSTAANPTALALAMAAAQRQQQHQQVAAAQPPPQQQVPPTSAPTTNVPIAAAAAPATKETASVSAAELALQHYHHAAATHPATVSLAGTADSLVVNIEEKKLTKRAANRKSAQLSRKRKKQFIEELREENAILRRKEQILRSIPDLVVVFDSAGRILFVSESVTRLLSFNAEELDGASFWDRLCGESVKLLKAAFMDALAVRSSGGCDGASVASSSSSKSKSKKAKAAKGDMMDVDSESVPLGSGMWELRLVDKDGSHHLVTLTGVVHFPPDESGHSTPECVCSIRPRETAQNVRTHFGRQPIKKRPRNGNVVDPSSSSSASSDDGNDGASNSPSSTSEGGQYSSNASSDSHFPPNLVRDAIKPQQSVVSNASCGSTSALSSDGDGTSKSVSGTKRPANDNEDSIISGGSLRVSG